MRSLSLILLMLSMLLTFQMFVFVGVCLHRKFECILLIWLRVQQFCFFFLFRLSSSFYFRCSYVHLQLISHYRGTCMVSQCTQIVCKTVYAQTNTTTAAEARYVLNANHFSVFPRQIAAQFILLQRSAK